MRSTLGSRPLSPDYETKEIKNIYVDSKFSFQLFLFFELVGLPIVTLFTWSISMSVELDCSTGDTNKCELDFNFQMSIFPPSNFLSYILFDMMLPFCEKLLAVIRLLHRKMAL